MQYLVIHIAQTLLSGRENFGNKILFTYFYLTKTYLKFFVNKDFMLPPISMALLKFFYL